MEEGDRNLHNSFVVHFRAEGGASIHFLECHLYNATFVHVDLREMLKNKNGPLYRPQLGDKISVLFMLSITYGKQ